MKQFQCQNQINSLEKQYKILNKRYKSRIFEKLDQKGSGRIRLAVYWGVHEFTGVATESSCQECLLIGILLSLWKQPRRVIDIFDDDGNGEVDFKEFIMGLSHFRFDFIQFLFLGSSWTNMELWSSWIEFLISVQREIWRVNWDLRSGGPNNLSVREIKFETFANLEPSLFRIYDMDNDGYISNGELFQVKYHARSTQI